eukprot:14042295-Alexandrium_andersonii.AAC.1
MCEAAYQAYMAEKAKQLNPLDCDGLKALKKEKTKDRLTKARDKAAQLLRAKKGRNTITLED